MEITETLYVTDRSAWRKWLQENYRQKSEIWLVYYKKHTGKPTIPYEHAVEEALCFGWIDGIEKRIDDERYAGRFTPRNPKTPYAESNQARLRRLLAEGKVVPELAATLPDLES
jgi:uncharacterized protein YdeI (YjbR/CyaY-like superfamily)